MDRARARQNLFYPRSRAAQLFVAPSSIPRDIVAIGRSEMFFLFFLEFDERKIFRSFFLRLVEYRRLIITAYLK